MSKRENESNPIRTLMQSFIKENNLSKGMQKLKIEEVWRQQMGQSIANYTTEVKLQNKTLIVRLTSSVLREELSYGKEKIIKMMNEEMGEELISKLMLV